MSFIPPLHITISGNRCGGCCRSSSVRETSVPYDYVVIYENGGFSAVPPDYLKKKRVQAAALVVFSEIQSRLRHVYAVSWEEIPPSVRPTDVTRPPLFAEVKMIESAAIGILEGRKSSSSIGSPPVVRTSSDESE